MAPETTAGAWSPDRLPGDIEGLPCPGDHYSVLARTQVSILAERLETRLGG